jgi:hypothetical protein
MADLIHFLLTYDVQEARLVEVREFRDIDEAVAAYEAAEAAHRNDVSLEIVLLGADSLETIKVTHANYFEADSREALLAALAK